MTIDECKVEKCQKFFKIVEIWTCLRLKKDRFFARKRKNMANFPWKRRGMTESELVWSPEFREKCRIFRENVKKRFIDDFFGLGELKMMQFSRETKRFRPFETLSWAQKIVDFPWNRQKSSESWLKDEFKDDNLRLEMIRDEFKVEWVTFLQVKVEISCKDVRSPAPIFD